MKSSFDPAEKEISELLQKMTYNIINEADLSEAKALLLTIASKDAMIIIQGQLKLNQTYDKGDLKEAVSKLHSEGRKIAGIKLIRNVTGLLLKESKDLYEEWFQNE